MNFRKRLIAFLLLFVIGVFTLVACGEGDKPSDTENDGKDTAEAIITENKEFSIIYDASSVSSDKAVSLGESLAEVTVVAPAIKTGDTAKSTSEIVIGNTERDISKAAAKRLNAALKNAIRNSGDEDSAEEDLAAYTVYSDGESIALVWTSDYGLDLVIDYFKETFLFDGLVLDEGYSKSVVFSITAYLEERATALREEAWAALGAQLPAEQSEEIITALRQLYGLYSSDIVVWLANLYDPGTGGFYFSNSARDNEGFLPDIETTYGIFGYMEATGMMEMYDGVWDDAIPDWLSDAVCDWMYELQDEDTFFYHPQWPKEYIEANGLQSRITRDRNSANTTLTRFGRTPKYAVNYTSSSANLLAGLGTGTVSAVSKVVATSDFMDKYSSVEAFAEYVKTMDNELKSKGDADKAYYFYAKGNEFQSITSSLPADVKPMVIDFFDKYQSEETGMWSESLYYDSTNGLHKVAAVYNSIGAPLKYTDKMLESTLEILLWTPEESPAKAGVDIYNALSCFPYIYKNVLKYGAGTEAEREATVEAYKTRVFESAVTIINYSFIQMTAFGYADGSFSYNRNTYGQGGKAQGAPVSIAGTKEGDVNGTYIASIDIIDHIMGALDLSDYTVPLFTEQERYMFINILEDLGPVIKGGASEQEPVFIDFEDCESETDIPVDINMSARDSTVYIAADAKGDQRLVVECTNWYASQATSSKRNANFTIPAGSTEKNAQVGVIEFAVSFEDLDTTVSSQFNIRFQNQSKGQIAFYTINIAKDGSYFYATINDGAGKNLPIKLYGGGGAEMLVRFEYYKNQGVTKAYVDGVFLGECSSIVNNEIAYDSVIFELQGGADMTVIFDDIRVEKANITYVKETPGTPPAYPLPKLGAASYGFEDCTVGAPKYPKDMTVTPNNGTATIVRGDDGKALNLAGIGGGLKANPSVSIYNYDVVEGGNGYVFETDLIVNSAPDKDKYSNMVKLQFMNGTSDVFQLLLQTLTVDGVHQMRIVDNADGGKSNDPAKDNANVLAAFKEGENVKIKVEFLPSKKSYKVYLNGALAGTGTTTKNLPVQAFKLSINSGAAIDITVDNIGLTRRNVAE